MGGGRDARFLAAGKHEIGREPAAPEHDKPRARHDDQLERQLSFRAGLPGLLAALPAIDLALLGGRLLRLFCHGIVPFATARMADSGFSAARKPPPSWLVTVRSQWLTDCCGAAPRAESFAGSMVTRA